MDAVDSILAEAPTPTAPAVAAEAITKTTTAQGAASAATGTGEAATKKKRKLRHAKEFKDNRWAQMINNGFDSLDPGATKPATTAMLGEAYIATGATYVNVEGEMHPGWHAAAATLAVGFVIGMNMLTTPRTKSKKEGLNLAARIKQ